MLPEIDLPIYERANIRPRELAKLLRNERRMREALVRIQEMAAEDIRMDVVISKSNIWQIEADAREAIED